MSDNKEILLNIMYNGDYLQSEGKNIGHEVINLFQTDEGENYIYILPYGCMAEKHNDKIQTILLVKRHNSSLLEIMAKAEGLEQIIRIKNTRSACQQEIHKAQVKYIQDNAINYGGVPLHEIMKENDGNEGQFYVTFKAQRVVRTKPKKRIFITTNENLPSPGSLKGEDPEMIYYHLKIKNFAKQSPKMYFSNLQKSEAFNDSETFNNSEAFNTLNNIINNPENWNRNKENKKIELPTTTQAPEKNFIDIIKKGYDELSYSNLFEYVFNIDNKLFQKFAEEVLGVKFSDKYTVERERANIDLLIHGEKKVVVIENKIKSGINGIICDEAGKKSDQLDKYKNYVNKEFKEEDGFKKSFYIFTPDYNNIGNKEGWTTIKYSEIYKFFVNYKTSHPKSYKELPYYDEFLYALEKHISDINNNNDIEAEKRFIKGILAFKKKKKG